MQHELATEHINHAGSRNVDIPHKPHQNPTPANKKQKLVRLQAGFSARRQQHVQTNLTDCNSQMYKVLPFFHVSQSLSVSLCPAM